jgi:hypothetical protein
LKSSHKRWAAAAINTRLLETRLLADSTSTNTGDAQLAFTEASQKVTRQAEILNLKRSEHARLADRSDTSTWSTEARTELAATLTAIDIIIARELESLHAAEAELDKVARSIDTAAQLAQDKKLEAESLQQAYHKALE